MNAREIQQAVEGVAAECLDPYLRYNGDGENESHWSDGIDMLHDSHAAKIQCDSMVEWLQSQENVLYVTLRKSDEGYCVVVWFTVQSNEMYEKTYAPTRLEALAKACRAMKEKA